MQIMGGSEACGIRRLGHPCIELYLCMYGQDKDYISYAIGAEAHISSAPGELRQDFVYLCASLGPHSHWGSK